MPGAKAKAPDLPPTDAKSEDAERQRLLDAVAEGLTDADSGRVRPHAEVVARMRARFAARSK